MVRIRLGDSTPSELIDALGDAPVRAEVVVAECYLMEGIDPHTVQVVLMWTHGYRWDLACEYVTEAMVSVVYIIKLIAEVQRMKDREWDEEMWGRSLRALSFPMRASVVGVVCNGVGKGGMKGIPH